jgi:hypothetical protein
MRLDGRSSAEQQWRSVSGGRAMDGDGDGDGGLGFSLRR